MALNQTGNGREEDRERKGEKDTRSPFMVAILPRGSDHVARGLTRRRWRSKGIEGRGKGYHRRGEGETKSQWVYHRDGIPRRGSR